MFDELAFRKGIVWNPDSDKQKRVRIKGPINLVIRSYVETKKEFDAILETIIEEAREENLSLEQWADKFKKERKIGEYALIKEEFKPMSEGRCNVELNKSFSLKESEISDDLTIMTIAIPTYEVDRAFEVGGIYNSDNVYKIMKNCILSIIANGIE